MDNRNLNNIQNMYNETAINSTAIFINLIFSSPPHFNRKIYKKRYPYQCINVLLDSTTYREVLECLIFS